MTDVLDGVRDHCRAIGLTERLKTALPVSGPNDQRLTPQQPGDFDQFHTRELAATTELAKLAGITAEMSVPDGCSAPRQAWLTVALLFLFMVINFADKAVIGIAAVPIMDELLLSPHEFGLIG